MKPFDALWKTHLGALMDEVRCATPEARPRAVGRVLGSLIPAIPLAFRSTPIESVKWSQPFVTNEWWRSVWQRLGVSTVADLATLGADLAATRGVGRTKLLVLLQDLVDLAIGAPCKAGPTGQRARSIEIIASTLHAIESGPPSPQPYLVKALLRALLDVLPPEVLTWEINAIPWSREWCYSTRVWSDLGVTVLADLDDVAFDLCRIHGIGRGKVVALARELIFLSPELEASLGLSKQTQVGTDPEATRSYRPARLSPRTGSLVSSIDRMADRLAARERDILHRRVGWRYDRKPEKLRTLSDAHGVSQERIRQIERQIRRRLLTLVRVRQYPDALRDAARSLPPPADLEAVIACRPAEFQGMMEVWRPLASLLAEDGGPYLYEDRRRAGRVLVSLVPGFRSAPRSQRRTASDSESPLRWPSTTPT